MNEILNRYSSRLPFSVQERDVDLLIMEQLHVSDSFANWLAWKVGLDGADFINAQHSVMTPKGETDVLIRLHHEGQTIAVMIEDKIGAAMQPHQCERYHIRGKELCELGDFSRYLTVLCAPSSYISQVPVSQPWECRITLEDIADSLERLGNHGWQWRQAILIAACTKIKRARAADDKDSVGYDSSIAQLKIDYQAFLGSQYPQILASTQRGRDREYYLKARGLPSGVRFKHAFFRGEVSLIFEKRFREQAEAWVSKNLPTDSWATSHGSELHIRKAVEIMDPELPLCKQNDVVRNAIDQICMMIPWATEVTNYTSDNSR